MAFINHEKKALFLHNVKCGGVHTRTFLLKYYGFETLTENTHKRYDDFVLNKKIINHSADTYHHAIRKFGKYRYFYTHQDVDKKIFNNYFIFTFVRNPYERIYSAYKYLKKELINNNSIKIHNTKEKIEYFKDFNTFILNREDVNNISYYHAFISQYDQFIDFSGNINISYIGKTETLNDDLLQILTLIGFEKFEHINEIYQNIKTNKLSEDNFNITVDFNEDTFKFVNEHFDKDFQLFGYKKYNTLKEFQDEYSRVMPLKLCETNNIDSELLCTVILKETNLIEHNDVLKKEITSKYENIIDCLIIGLKENEKNNIMTNEINKINNEIELLKKKLLVLDDLSYKKIDFIKKKISVLNKNNTNKTICKTCSFMSYNKLSSYVHNCLCYISDK